MGASAARLSQLDASDAGGIRRFQVQRRIDRRLVVGLWPLRRRQRAALRCGARAFFRATPRLRHPERSRPSRPGVGGRAPRPHQRARASPSPASPRGGASASSRAAAAAAATAEPAAADPATAATALAVMAVVAAAAAAAAAAVAAASSKAAAACAEARQTGRTRRSRRPPRRRYTRRRSSLVHRIGGGGHAPRHATRAILGIALSGRRAASSARSNRPGVSVCSATSHSHGRPRGGDALALREAVGVLSHRAKLASHRAARSASAPRRCAHLRSRCLTTRTPTKLQGRRPVAVRIAHRNDAKHRRARAPRRRRRSPSARGPSGPTSRPPAPGTQSPSRRSWAHGRTPRAVPARTQSCSSCCDTSAPAILSRAIGTTRRGLAGRRQGCGAAYRVVRGDIVGIRWQHRCRRCSVNA